MKRVLAIILGGGAGTRLYPLTKLRAKPAVPLGAKYGSVAIFPRDVSRGALIPSVEGLGGQRVEQFGRSEAFTSKLDHQLFLLDHVHELDPNECVLGCLERFEPQHGPCHPLYTSMILLHDVVYSILKFF